MAQTGIILYTTNELMQSNCRRGIPGFIDEIGLQYLRETEQLLGAPIYVAAGRCPNCGEIQMTIYSGFKTTNCLKCGFELKLATNLTNKTKGKFLDEVVIDIGYEEAEDEHDMYNLDYRKICKTMYTVHIPKVVHQWPIIRQNPWYKRYPNVILFKLKTLWQDMLISMLIR